MVVGVLVSPRVARWLPLAATVAFVAMLLLRAGTAPLDLGRYALYAGLSVILPGLLVYRSLRGRPHTLVEDVAMGAAVGLVLEVAGWAVFSVLNLRAVSWLWPVLVIGPFLGVPRLRRHWRARYEVSAPLGWSWLVAGAVAVFTTYLAAGFLDRNPIVPTSENTMQYLDLAYQLSLAGEAKHSFPPHLPQVAGDPLYYHWFAYVHMAMTSMVGHIDLTVVAMRLAIPALCALATLLTAVVGWRVSGRPYVGAVAAVLFFAVGEFNFTNPVSLPFGTEATFVIWHGMSMIYAWVLLLAVIAPLCSLVSRDASYPTAGALALAGILIFGSSGAKASSLPVIAVVVGVMAVGLWIARRRLPWPIIGAGILVVLAEVFAVAVLFHFQTYGLKIGLWSGLSLFWDYGGGPTDALVPGVLLAFWLNLLLRTAGIIPLLWLRRVRLEPAQWLLVVGGLAGTAFYLVLAQPGSGNQYFVRTGFAFAVIASAWGFVEVWDRARLGRRGAWALVAVTGAWVGALTWFQLARAEPAPTWYGFAAVSPLLGWALLLAVVIAAGGALWFLAARAVPRLDRLRGVGPVVALALVLSAGGPGLVLESVKSIQVPNGGPYYNVNVPASRVQAARWVRDHSDPDDVLATNVHCLGYFVDGTCDSRSFWLSAYAERSVFVEGWGFSPRLATVGLIPFWDPARITLNDAAFTAPSPAVLDALRADGVRWLVVDRAVGVESPDLAKLAALAWQSADGRMVVYRL